MGEDEHEDDGTECQLVSRKLNRIELNNNNLKLSDSKVEKTVNDRWMDEIEFNPKMLDLIQDNFTNNSKSRSLRPP